MKDEIVCPNCGAVISKKGAPKEDPLVLADLHQLDLEEKTIIDEGYNENDPLLIDSLNEAALAR